MIGQRTAKRTARQDTDAYELTTDRDNATCVRCGRGGNCQRDHRQNRMRNNTVLENLQLLCGPEQPSGGCHLWKTDHPDAANRQGFGCPRWAKPAEYPARRWVPTEHGTVRQVWVLYVRDIDLFSYPLGYRIITNEDARDRISGLNPEVHI